MRAGPARRATTTPPRCRTDGNAPDGREDTKADATRGDQNANRTRATPDRETRRDTDAEPEETAARQSREADMRTPNAE